jgi:chemotaxis protein CheX
MQANQINPLLESTINVLTTMAMVDITSGKPCVKEHNGALGDISAIMDLTGSDKKGSLCISFSSAAILAISNNMLGEQLNSIDDTIADVVGEITNMITGSAKRIYSEQGIDFELTRPTTLIGNDQAIIHSVEGTTIVLPFAIEAGTFYVEVCFSA